MAMVKCADCGAHISSSAKSCPQCGAPPPKKKGMGFLGWSITGLVIFVGFVAIGMKKDKETLTAAAPPPTPAPVAEVLSPQDQIELTTIKGMSGREFCAEVGEDLRFPRGESIGSRTKMLLRRASDDFAVVPEDYDYIKRLKLRVGMSWCSVVAAWGPPDSSNKTVTATGTRMQYVYGGGKYAYTHDGVLTAWQE